jgi:hypothetical protein
MHSRRAFLKGALATVASISLINLSKAQSKKPIVFNKKVKVKKSVIVDGFTIDSKTKKISYAGSSDNQISVLDFYKHLSDEWDKPNHMDDDVPMVAITPNMFEVQNEWIITEDSFKNFKDGSIRNGNGDIYAHVYHVGQIDDTCSTCIYQNGKPISNWIRGKVNVLVKAKQGLMKTITKRFNRTEEFTNCIGFGSYPFPYLVQRNLWE